MPAAFDPTSDVFTYAEVARAADTDAERVRSVVARGLVATCGHHPLLSCREAVRAVVHLRQGGGGGGQRPLFAPPPEALRQPAGPFIASGGMHLAVAAVLAFATTVGVTTNMSQAPLETRLVFLATPGPGGGGGGGGNRQPAPARQARLDGPRRLRSPITPRRPADRRPEQPVRPAEPEPPIPKPEPPAPEPPPPAPAPAATAPVATVAADNETRPGVLDEGATGSQGPGSDGGSGTGTGTGMGEGTGPGIGPGSGGGIGGGPFRPGSGVTPPRLVHEVKPDYTDEARRRGVNGEVVLEVVVQRDGRVGDIRVIQGLGGGLDRRAIEAVRQWRFAPGERLGTPVDVVVEVAVEFRLR
jgi:TonB family protein